jgi:hypothetical protein
MAKDLGIREYDPQEIQLQKVADDYIRHNPHWEFDATVQATIMRSNDPTSLDFELNALDEEERWGHA